MQVVRAKVAVWLILLDIRSCRSPSRRLLPRSTALECELLPRTVGQLQFQATVKPDVVMLSTMRFVLVCMRLPAASRA
ncbi:hypothetical protein BKA93DRAFT_69070 [Sparassis latifolia]